MSSRPHLREAEFAVYLVDPGPKPSSILGLLCDITGESLEASALLLRQTPVLIALAQTQEGARDVVARLREFDAVAIIRRANEPMTEGADDAVTGSNPQRVIFWMLLVLAILQIPAALWWWAEGNPFAGVGGLVLGVCIITWSVVRLRSPE